MSFVGMHPLLPPLIRKTPVEGDTSEHARNIALLMAGYRVDFEPRMAAYNAALGALSTKPAMSATQEVAPNSPYYRDAFFWVARVLTTYGDKVGPSTHALIAERIASLSMPNAQVAP